LSRKTNCPDPNGKFGIGLTQVYPSPFPSSEGIPDAVSGSIPRDSTVTSSHFSLALVGQPPIDFPEALDTGIASKVTRTAATTIVRFTFPPLLADRSANQVRADRTTYALYRRRAIGGHYMERGARANPGVLSASARRLIR